MQFSVRLERLRRETIRKDPCKQHILGLSDIYEEDSSELKYFIKLAELIPRRKFVLTRVAMTMVSGVLNMF